LEVDVRAAQGLPFGKVDGSPGDSLNQTFAFATPLIVDVGYRVDPKLSIGVYGSYAFASSARVLRDDCSALGVRCATADIRLGLEAQVHSSSARVWDPWIGLGSGYERAEINTTSGQSSISGWEILHVDAGIDLRPSNAVGLGPFVTWTLGQYDYESLPGQGVKAVTDRNFHEWLLVGVRGTLDIQVGRTSQQSRADCLEP
jgi:hypothetical protein